MPTDRTPDPPDVEALTDALGSRRFAARLLASDWLAARDAAMRAEGAAAVRREVEAAAVDILATRDRPHPLDGSNDSYYREGWADCTEEAGRAIRAALDRAEGVTPDG